MYESDTVSTKGILLERRKYRPKRGRKRKLRRAMTMDGYCWICKRCTTNLIDKYRVMVKKIRSVKRELETRSRAYIKIKYSNITEYRQKNTTTTKTIKLFVSIRIYKLREEKIEDHKN